MDDGHVGRNATMLMNRGTRFDSGQVAPTTAVAPAITAPAAISCAHGSVTARNARPAAAGTALRGMSHRHTLWLNSFQANTPNRIGFSM
jgi:hypothetical protein